jgi:hypothetical protein
MTDAKLNHLKDVALFRGFYINEIIKLEKLIDLFVAQFFCKNDEIAEDLLGMLLGTERISLNNKKNILFDIINKHFPELLIEFPDLKTDIQELITIRNVLAHQMLDTSGEFDKIEFLKTNADRKKYPYEKQYAIDKTTLISKYIGIFMKILGMENLSQK